MKEERREGKYGKKGWGKERNYLEGFKSHLCPSPTSSKDNNVCIISLNMYRPTINIIWWFFCFRRKKVISNVRKQKRSLSHFPWIFRFNVTVIFCVLLILVIFLCMWLIIVGKNWLINQGIGSVGSIWKKIGGHEGYTHFEISIELHSFFWIFYSVFPILLKSCFLFCYLQILWNVSDFRITENLMAYFSFSYLISNYEFTFQYRCMSPWPWFNLTGYVRHN